MEPDLRVDEIKKHVPFRPFRLHVSDGTVHVVADPDLVLVTRHTIVLGLRRAGEVIPGDTIYRDPVHITKVEVVTDPPVA